MGTCEVLNSHYFPLCSGMVINIQYSLLEVFLITDPESRSSKFVWKTWKINKRKKESEKKSI